MMPSADSNNDPLGPGEADGAGGMGDLGAVFEMPGHLLRRCQQIAVAIFLDECEGFDITPPQFATLSALARHGPLDQSTLGGVVALDRTTIAIVLKNLRSRDLVEVRPSSADRRSKISRITEEGALLLKEIRGSVETAQQRILAPLPADEQADFLRMLTKIAHDNNAQSRAPRKLPPGRRTL